MPAYFAGVDASYVCPDHFTPADFAADLISRNYTSPEAEEESRWRCDAAGWGGRNKVDVVEGGGQSIITTASAGFCLYFLLLSIGRFLST